MFDPATLQAVQQMGGGDDAQMKDMLRQMGLPEDGSDQGKDAHKMPSYASENKQITEVTRLLEWVSEQHGVMHQEGRLDCFWKLLDDRLQKEFFDHAPAEELQQANKKAAKKDECMVPYRPVPHRFPAIDFHSGVAVLCVEFSKRYRQYLDMIPTESEAPVVRPDHYDDKPKSKKPYHNFPPSRHRQLQAALQYFFDTDNDGPVLAADKFGMALYKNSKVKLSGLAREGYNGRKGKVLGRDANDSARLGIKLETKNKPISLKPANLERTDGGLKYEEGIQIEQDRQLLLQMKRYTCPVQIDDIESWEESLRTNGYYGQCVLATYVTMRRGKPLDEENYGMDESTAEHAAALMGPPPKVSWKKLLVLAGHLLRPGGFLLQYDCASASEQYGDVDAMKKHVHNLSLDLELLVRDIPIDDPQSDSPMICMLWQKKKQ